MNLFFAVINGAALDKLHHGVNEHLGVDAEVVLGFKRHACRVRDSADAELDAGAVGDLLGNEIADDDACLVECALRKLRQGDIVFNYRVHLSDMKLHTGDCARHILVYLDENALRPVKQRLTAGACQTEAEISVLVHRGHGHAVGVKIVSRHKLRYVAVVGGDKIAVAAVDGFSCARA